MPYPDFAQRSLAVRSSKMASVFGAKSPLRCRCQDLSFSRFGVSFFSFFAFFFFFFSLLPNSTTTRPTRTESRSSVLIITGVLSSLRLSSSQYSTISQRGTVLSATSHGLTADKNALVSRRDTRKNPLCYRLADDIISLIVCLKNNSTVLSLLLKN